MEKKFIYDEQTAVVDTEKGKVRGYFYDDMYIFKGIPYAKAKRFHAPEPADAWEGVFQAVSYGCVCPLLDLPKPGGELMVPHRFWVMDEDCLHLNIWSRGWTGRSVPLWYGSTEAVFSQAPPLSRLPMRARICANWARWW